MANVNSALNQLNNSVNSFESNVDVHVKKVDSSTANVQRVAHDIYNKVEKFRTDIMHGEEQQITYKNILRIDQVIKEQFGNYDAIRKTIMGVVRDFDINLVRNSTIEELSEELSITSSRYWLSYALLAVTAWVNNYPDVARNALSESARKDATKSSLFFCLLNLRFDRVATAKKWFSVYCKSLNPICLQQETAVMIQAFMGGVFGKDKELEHEVTSITNEWIRIISENATICEELIQAYMNYFEKFNQGAEYNYDMILQFCTNSDEIRRSFIDASKYDKLIKLVEELNVDGDVQTDDNYKSRIDVVLINLITNFDEDERELKNEQQYYHMIIDNKGDKVLAEDQFQEMKRIQDQSYNFGRQMVDWAIYNNDTDVQVRKFGLQSTKHWFETALERWTSVVKERCPLQYSFAIDEWTSVSNGRDMEDQRTSLKNFFKNNEFRMIAINTLNIALVVLFFVALAITVASIAISIKSKFTPALIIGFVLLFASVVILVWRYFSGKKKFQQRVDLAVYNLESTMTQIIEFQRYFTENIRKKDDMAEIEMRTNRKLHSLQMLRDSENKNNLVWLSNEHGVRINVCKKDIRRDIGRLLFSSTRRTILTSATISSVFNVCAGRNGYL